MNPQEDYKRKYSGVISYKNNPATIVSKDRRKTDISREKEDKKYHHPTERAHTKVLAQGQDENTKINSTKAINFRNLKDTIPKKELPPHMKKNVLAKPCNPSEYYSKPIKPAHSPNQGISINVNIQNMIPHQRLANFMETEKNEHQTHIPKSDRSLLGEDKNEKRTKKTPLLNPAKKFDEFECDEELNFKKPLVETKGKFQEKTI